MSLTPSNINDWNGRITQEKAYVYQRVQCTSLEEIKNASNRSFGIVGYGVDEGVKRNQGRIGAALGPKAFRRSFSTLADHFDQSISLFDLGTIQCEGILLEQAQDQLTEVVFSTLNKGITPIVIGGGHDIAYGHFKGIQRAYPHKRIGIINFDAHLDLRPFKQGAHSGSPFNQIADEINEFHYLCIGFRKNANTPSLIKRANELQVQLIDRSISTLHHMDIVRTKIDEFSKKVDLLYLTIDLDGFADAYAPGVSASSPLGFDPDFAFACINHILLSKKIISVDIAELNPTYDIDTRTSKLAAGLIYHLIDHWV